MPLLALLAALQSFNSPALLCGTARRCAACAASAVSFVNPLDIDGFVEPGGWGTVSEHEGAPLPLLCFLPGMDGSLSTAFMQYPELGTCFELQCMQHAGGLDSRASFDELVASGIHLTRHYVHKMCTPTRTSVQSGRLPVHVNTGLGSPADQT